MSPTRAESAPSATGASRRARLREARLYLVTDDATPEERLPELVSEAVRGGVQVVQLRRKQASPEELHQLAQRCRDRAREGGALFLVDDYPELALEVDADGVHLGQDDLDPTRARQLLGPECLIGLSTHDRDQARAAVRRPVDYISAGPVHATPTKPGRPPVGLAYVSEAARLARVPVVAIGGLGPGEAGAAVRAGADMVGVVRALCSAPDPGALALRLRREIEGAARWTRLVVNGEERRVPPGCTAEELLASLGVGERRAVVERNGEILEQAHLARVRLAEADRLEIVHLVGGGCCD